MILNLNACVSKAQPLLMMKDESNPPELLQQFIAMCPAGRVSPVVLFAAPAEDISWCVSDSNAWANTA
jgi:hypothetical protein